MASVDEQALGDAGAVALVEDAAHGPRSAPTASGAGDADARWAEATAEVNAAYALHDSYSAEHKLQQQRHTTRASELLGALAPASARERALLAFLCAKLRDANESYSEEIEEALTRAVKLDPSSVDAWNTLAECVWKGGKLELARCCFQRALAVRANVVSLCQLSLLVRTMSGAAAEPALPLESLRFAKEALALDMGCGKAWYVLGNAYMACYFNSTDSQGLTDLHSALKAYRRAADAPRQPQAGCADLHYNMGVALQYVLRYTESCRAFATAHALAPELGAAAQRRALCAFAYKCADAVRLRGHVPRKRLQQLERALRASPRPPAAAAAVAGRALADCSVAGLCEGANDGVALSATVVAELVPASGTPISYVLVDAAGDAILLCAYDTVPAAIQLYRTLTVLAPSKRTLAVPADLPGGGADELRVDCLVVEESASRLLVQGKALERAHVGRARVTSSTAHTGGGAAAVDH